VYILILSYGYIQIRKGYKQWRHVQQSSIHMTCSRTECLSSLCSSNDICSSLLLILSNLILRHSFMLNMRPLIKHTITIQTWLFYFVKNYNNVTNLDNTYISKRKTESWSFPSHSSFFATLLLISGNSSKKSVSKGALKQLI